MLLTVTIIRHQVHHVRRADLLSYSTRSALSPGRARPGSCGPAESRILLGVDDSLQLRLHMRREAECLERGAVGLGHAENGIVADWQISHSSPFCC